MKNFIKLLSVAVLLAATLCACSNVPKEPATTELVAYTYMDPLASTIPEPENASDYPGVTMADKYIAAPVGIDFLMSSYHVYKNTVAKITNVEIEYQNPALYLNAVVTVQLEAIGKAKNGLKIGYKCLDGNGNALNGAPANIIDIDLTDCKKGDTVENVRIILPKGTVKVEFFNVED